MSSFSVELEHFALAQSLNLHTSIVRSVDIADTLLLSSGLDNCTYLYSQENDRYNLIQAYGLHQGAVYVNKFNKTDLSYFFTGGGDSKAVCSDLEGANTVSFLGHEGTVCSLDCAGGTLITGSWDATGKLWDISTQQCVATLGKQHHNYAVTVLASPTGFLTGSQNGKLNLWSLRGEHIRSINAHSDIIREIKLVPGVGFATCSNDQTVKVWTEDGRLVHTLAGHNGYVFCLEVGPDGLIFSGSDDRTVKIWANGACIDTLELPNSVWSLRLNPAGDLATACGDKEVRVFTKSQLRVASQTELEEFKKQCEAAVEATQEAMDTSKMPDISLSKNFKGKKDGAYKMFSENGKAFAYCWHEDGQYWEKIGEVESQAPQSSSKFYPGDEVFPQGEYDYIFDVDFGEGRILRLPYNNSQNPLEVAEKFVVREHLHREFLFQIEAFINKNAKPSWNAPQVVSKAEVMAQYFPCTQFLLFDSVNMDPIVKKIVELNGSLSASVALDQGEVEQLGRLSSTLSNKAAYRSSSITRKDFLVVNKLITWPVSHMFPVLDLLRVLQMHPGSGELYKGSEQGAKIVSPAVAMLSQGAGPGLITATRLLCNLFGENTSLYAVQKRRQAVLEAALTHIDSDVKPLRLSLATLLMNYSALFIQKDDPEGRIQIISAITDFIQKETDEETLFRGFVTVGNLLCGGGIQPELVELAGNLGMRDVVSSKQVSSAGKAKAIAKELLDALFSH